MSADSRQRSILRERESSWRFLPPTSVDPKSLKVLIPNLYE